MNQSVYLFARSENQILAVGYTRKNAYACLLLKTMKLCRKFFWRGIVMQDIYLFSQVKVVLELGFFAWHLPNPPLSKI